MRAPFVCVLALGLAACTSQVPDSGAGVGFQDYNSYLRERSRAPQPVVPPPVTPAPSTFTPSVAAAALDRVDGVAPAPVPAPLPPVAGGDVPRGNAPSGIRVETGEMDALANTGISDEQDFDAVSSRESIESDRARIERNRAQYQVIQPGALPVRPGSLGPNIVDFALATSHPPGTQLYKRSSFGSGGNGCNRYASPDLAQEDFLASGGPERDRKRLDPDGDGYACAWDPRPFRTARQ